MPGDRVAGLALDLVQRPFELLVGERLELPAGGADEMVVMLPTRMHRLVAGGARAEVDPLEQALLGQELEDAVDARDSDLPAFGPKLVEDLLRRQAAVLSSEQLDDGPPGDTVSVPAAAERMERLLRPVSRLHRDR